MAATRKSPVNREADVGLYVALLADRTTGLNKKAVHRSFNEHFRLDKSGKFEREFNARMKRVLRHMQSAALAEAKLKRELLSIAGWITL